MKVAVLFMAHNNVACTVERVKFRVRLLPLRAEARRTSDGPVKDSVLATVERRVPNWRWRELRMRDEKETLMMQ